MLGSSRYQFFSRRSKSRIMSGLYKLGEFEVDSTRRQILLNGEVIPLPQKPFEVLLVLMGRAGEVVTKDELMQTIWPSAFVEESNLTQSIFLLRKAFTDKAAGSRFIVTIPGIGYQLGVIPIAIDSAVEEASVRSQEIQLSSSDLNPEVAQPLTALNVLSSPRNDARRRYVVMAIILAAGGAILIGLSVRLLRPAAFSNFSVRRLTNSGDVQLTTVSRSGKYLAFVSKNAAGGESLSLLEVRSGNSHVILQDGAMIFQNLAISPDESYVYYRGHRKDNSDGISKEYRLPLLGGEPTSIVNDIDGPATFIKGGEQICFLRNVGDSQFVVLSSDADSGRNEKTLAKGERPLPQSAVCSPDGQRAALSSEVGGITILDFKTGQRKAFYEPPAGREIYIDLNWKPDGSGLLATAVSPFNLYPSLFTVSYPDGVRTQITHDLNSYVSPSMTGDGSTIVALQRDKNAHFQSFELPLLDANPEVISFPWSDFLGWRNDEQIIGSTTSGGLKVKSLVTGQESSIQTAGGVQFLQPSGCGSSALVAAGGRPSDKNISIWYMNADGSDMKQISHGSEDILPVCTADGKWVVYADNSELKRAAIYRVPAEGGTPQKIGEGSVWFALSHAGESVARIDGAGGRQTLVIAQLGTGKQLLSLPVPAALRTVRTLTFAPDDQHVFVIAKGETSDSIYDLPLDGAAPTKRVEFRGAQLAAIMVSPSGKYLGAVSVKPVSDAVLLEDRGR
jgi:DNA-binding winged helix-turn-helix (wHTH) protein/Tol biopolymer transport system component